MFYLIQLKYEVCNIFDDEMHPLKFLNCPLFLKVLAIRKIKPLYKAMVHFCVFVMPTMYQIKSVYSIHMQPFLKWKILKWLFLVQTFFVIQRNPLFDMQIGRTASQEIDYITRFLFFFLFKKKNFDCFIFCFNRNILFFSFIINLLQIFTSHGPTLVAPTWFFSRKLYDLVGGFCERYGSGFPEDLEFFYNALRIGCKLHKVNFLSILFPWKEALLFLFVEDTIFNQLGTHLFIVQSFVYLSPAKFMS